MADKKLFFEDVKVGEEIPPLVKKPTNVQLFMFSAATWNRARIHYDSDYARNNEGLPDILVHRPLQGSFLAQLLTDWMGEEGSLKKFSWSVRISSVPGDTLTCRGKVIGKHLKDKEHLVECELWIENQRGEKVTFGKATLALPSRG